MMILTWKGLSWMSLPYILIHILYLPSLGRLYTMSYSPLSPGTTCIMCTVY